MPRRIELSVNVLRDGTFVAALPCGGTVALRPVPGGGFTYEGSKADGSPVVWLGGSIPDRARALRLAWVAAITLPGPLDLEQSEVHAEALACDRDVKRFAATLKRYLRARTGVTFSVSRGRGTASGWVSVREMGQRDGESLGPESAATLEALFGHIAMGEMSVRPGGGERVGVVCRAAGFPLPPGFVVRPPDWD